MNDDFSDLETELRALQPLAPSALLEERVAHALAAAPVSVAAAMPWWQLLGFQRPLAAFTWGFATPAAAVCAVLLLHGFPLTSQGSATTNHLTPAAPAKIASNGFEPATTSNVVYRTSDEGIVSDDEQKPARQVRYLSNETLAWHNPRTGAQVEVSYPREEVVVTPIALR